MSGGDPTRVEGVEPQTRTPSAELPTRTPTVPAAMNDTGHAAGTNAKPGTESEREAPGPGSE